MQLRFLFFIYLFTSENYAFFNLLLKDEILSPLRNFILLNFFKKNLEIGYDIIFPST